MDISFAMRLFVQVVEDGSFSTAGPKLGVTQSSASRQVSGLEEALGIRLMQRTTRKLQLTEAGQVYYERARQIVADIDEAKDAVHRLRSDPSGVLRVTAPASLWAAGYCAVDQRVS